MYPESPDARPGWQSARPGQPPGGDAPSEAFAQDAVTYQLHIRLARAIRIAPGRLGAFRLEPGWYVYTGSARRHLRARVARHLRRDKPCRWHIDWLLTRREATVYWVALRAESECRCNRSVGGAVPIPGFGASDCRAGCGSHLRYLGTGRPGAIPADARRRRRRLAQLRRG